MGLAPPALRPTLRSPRGRRVERSRKAASSTIAMLNNPRAINEVARRWVSRLRRCDPPCAITRIRRVERSRKAASSTIAMSQNPRAIDEAAQRWVSRLRRCDPPYAIARSVGWNAAATRRVPPSPCRTPAHHRRSRSAVGLAPPALRPTLRSPRGRRVERSRKAASSTIAMSDNPRAIDEAAQRWVSRLRRCDPPYAITGSVGWNAAAKRRVPPSSC